jgi:pimeloyl-ACP methyl ester carboxylesterase/glycine cleavage system regulatory protein
MKVCVRPWPALPRAAPPDDHLTWHRTTVDGRPAAYGVGGPNGPPVVFLHGWALGSRAYKRAIRRLTSRGCRVYAPGLPSFGGTADLPAAAMDIDGYATWVSSFMSEVGIDEPALVIGHSFGGGVAIKLADNRPDLVRYLVLLNAIGGGAPRRPWEWLAGFGRELWPLHQGIETVQAMRADLVPNLIRNPLGLGRAGRLAQNADLRSELIDLRERGVPVLVLTSEGDGVIPRGAFEALCDAVGVHGHVISGRHSWLLADPDSFGEVLAAIVDVQVSEHRASRASSRADELASLLEQTRVSNRTAQALLREAPPLWLMSESAATLAGDIALCHPKLGRNEVRAVARPIERSRLVRLTVVAADRRGLLADSAAVLALNNLSITHASAATWPRRQLALHSFVVDGGASLDEAAWTRLGDDLRALVSADSTVLPTLRPVHAVRVTVQGTDGDRSMVRVTAPDQLGLLSALCRWFAAQDANIESLHARTTDGVADDTFLVVGYVVGDALAGHLEQARSRTEARS